MNNAIEKVKLLLGITDDSKDEILSLHLDMVVQDVLIYTNRQEVPEALWCTIARLVRLSMISALGADYEAPVSSVSEAGRSVSFATAQMTEEEIKRERDSIYITLNRFKLMFRDS